MVQLNAGYFPVSYKIPFYTDNYWTVLMLYISQQSSSALSGWHNSSHSPHRSCKALEMKKPLSPRKIASVKILSIAIKCKGV